MYSPLYSLPVELLLGIVSNLTPKAIYHLTLTCRHFHDNLTTTLHARGLLDHDGISALEWASRRGHICLLKLLLLKGVDFNPPNSMALHLAALCNRLNAIRFLVDNGTDINKTDRSEGKTALHMAVDLPWVDTIRLLLEMGADWTLVDSRNQDTPLHTAARSGNTDIVRLLLEHGEGSLWVRNMYNETPMHRAAYAGRLEVVRLLLQKGADLNVQDDEGKTPLHRAACSWNGSVEMLRLMLQNGANMNFVDEDGATVLHSAAEFGTDADMVRFLIWAGADVHRETLNGDTPVMLAAHEGHVDLSELLEKAMGGMSP